MLLPPPGLNLMELILQEPGITQNAPNLYLKNSKGPNEDGGLGFVEIWIYTVVCVCGCKAPLLEYSNK